MIWSRISGIACLIWLTGCQPPEQEPDLQVAASELGGELAQASYSMGYIVASNISDQFGGNVDEEAFASGVHDRFAGNERQVSEEDSQRALAALVAKRQAAEQEKSAGNISGGEEFLAENGKREGVTTTQSGLQYEILVAGDGAKPADTDTVSTHYHGTLIDGKVFDSSVDRGEPLSIPVNRVISGWTEALQLMAVGSKWRLFIPPGLAYGSRGAGEIPPNSTLIFEVELLGIEGAG